MDIWRKQFIYNSDSCGCGSGKKRADCCGFVERTIQLDDRSQEAIERQLVLFKAKFGREPGPGDPVFFDPECDVPTPISEEKIMGNIVNALKQVVPDRPEFIYAFKKVGVLVTEENASQVLPEDRKQWDRAVKEYRRLIKEGKAPEL